MTHAFANILRNLAVILTLGAERLDPQPALKVVWPFEVHTATDTQGHEAHITWHRAN